MLSKQVIEVENEQELLNLLDSEFEKETIDEVRSDLVLQKENHYVDNGKMYQAFIKFHEKLKENPNERIPEYIGACFIKIATHFAMKPSFSQYPFLDEMIGDAIENCVMYAKNFDPNRSKYPFAYFTTFVYRAFLRRIEREKKQLYVKALRLRNMDEVDENETFEVDEREDADKQGMTPMAEQVVIHGDEIYGGIIPDFERRLREKRDKVAKRKVSKKVNSTLKGKVKVKRLTFIE